MPRDPSAIRLSYTHGGETDGRDRSLERADHGRNVDHAVQLNQNSDVGPRRKNVAGSSNASPDASTSGASVFGPAFKDQVQTCDPRKCPRQNESPDGEDVIPIVTAAVYESTIQSLHNPTEQQGRQQPVVVHTAKETTRNPDGSIKIVTVFTFSDGSQSRREEIHANHSSAVVSYDEEASSEILPDERNRHDQSPPTGHPGRPKQQKSERQTSRDTALLVTVIFACLMIAGLAVGLGVGLSSNTSNQNSTAPNVTIVRVCTLCYGGSAPADSSMDFSPEGPPCQDLITSTYGDDDDECLQIQSQAYYACGCPTLPPVRASPLCNVCVDGTFPPPKADEVVDYGEILGWDRKYRNITCEAEAVRISYEEPKTGSIPFSTCKDFQDGIGFYCGCPGTPLNSTESTKCTLCYGGAQPANPSLEYFPGSVTCGELDTTFLNSDDDACLGINAQAYWTCGCPDLPPVRAVPVCNLCPDGTFPPPNSDAVVDWGEFDMEGKFRNITCEAQAVRISYDEPTTGWIPFTSCQGFQDGFGEVCGCPPA